MLSKYNKHIKYGLSASLGIIIAYLIDKKKKKMQEKQEIAVDNKKNKSHENLSIKLKERKKLLLHPVNLKECEVSTLYQELKWLEKPTCDIIEIPHLATILSQKVFPVIPNPLWSKDGHNYRTIFGGGGFLPDETFTFSNSFILGYPSFSLNQDLQIAEKYVRAGPRQHIYFHPNDVKALIITSNKMCQGINCAIQDIVLTLQRNYGVQNIWGVKNGFMGITESEWVKLNEIKVKKIHNLGGNILGIDPNGAKQFTLDFKKIIETLEKKQINQVYLIGDFEEHLILSTLYEMIEDQKLKIAICGLPATPEKLFPVVETTVGFDTTIQESQKAIQSAYSQSNSCKYGVSIVKMIGETSGYVNLYSCLSSRDVNVCLIPEFGFFLNQEYGLLEHIYKRLLEREHILIAVSEGAYKSLIDEEIPIIEIDKFGKPRYMDIAEFLSQKIRFYCEKKGMRIISTIADNTSQIKSTPANPSDKKLIYRQCQNVCHALMAGFTGCLLGSINSKTAIIPLRKIIEKEKAVALQPYYHNWQSLLASTGQPSFFKEDIFGE